MSDNSKNKNLINSTNLIITFIALILTIVGVSLKDLMPSLWHSIFMFLMILALLYFTLSVFSSIETIYEKNYSLIEHLKKIESQTEISVSCKNDCKNSISGNLDEKTNLITNKLDLIDGYLSDIERKINSESEKFALYNLQERHTLVIISQSLNPSEYAFKITGKHAKLINIEGKNIPKNGISNMSLVQVHTSNKSHQTTKNYVLITNPGICIGIFTYIINSPVSEKITFSIEVKNNEEIIDTLQVSLI